MLSGCVAAPLGVQIYAVLRASGLTCRPSHWWMSHQKNSRTGRSDCPSTWSGPLFALAREPAERLSQARRPHRSPFYSALFQRGQMLISGLGKARQLHFWHRRNSVRTLFVHWTFADANTNPVRLNLKTKHRSNSKKKTTTSDRVQV